MCSTERKQNIAALYLMWAQGRRQGRREGEKAGTQTNLHYLCQATVKTGATVQYNTEDRGQNTLEGKG